jgi:signal transduction histidine kinase
MFLPGNIPEMEGALKRLEKIEEMPVESSMDSTKATLASSDLFKGLSDDELETLLPLCRVEVYEAGMVIACEGEACRYVQTIESGKVALETNIAIGRTSVESATIDVLSDGSNLCVSALIEPSILTDTGRCLETTRVLALDSEGLRTLFEENPQIGYKVARNLAKVVSSRLQNTKDTMGRILSVIFHDLKAPVAAVESYNRLLLGEFAGELNEEQKNIVQRSSKRLSDLLDLLSNMIDFSRVGFADLKMERISTAKVIEDCVEVMYPLAKEKGLQLVTEVPQELPAIPGSQERLKQVVTNLLSNAIKFTPSGGTVTVRAKDEQDFVQVEVADTGIGIPVEELPKLFDGFYRGLDMAGRGAGLGLSISKKIVEAHHGRIWAVSPCPESGRGSKFTFTLSKDWKKAGERPNSLPD